MKQLLLITAALGLFVTSALAQPDAASLGLLEGTTRANGFLNEGEVSWYRFEYASEGSSTGFLDITTNYEDEGVAITDTLLALFSSDGTLVSMDGEDDGFGLLSTMSFGQGSGQVLGDAFNLGGDGVANGEHGDIADGTYYLALGGFETFFDHGFFASSSSQLSGTYRVTFHTNGVPEPSAHFLFVAALGLVSIMRRS